MQTLNIIAKNIFKIKSKQDFNTIALQLFKLHATYNTVYKQFLDLIKVNVKNVEALNQIPFLPIELFKTHKIGIFEQQDSSIIFTSSATGNMGASKHYVQDIDLYEKSFLHAFNTFYGNVIDYCFVCLLPSYLDRQGSSLVYMCDVLIKNSKHPQSNFYLNNLDNLYDVIMQLKLKKQKTILIGVTYALLDFVENFEIADFDNLIVMETGGMKGKRKELTKEEMHNQLSNGFGVKLIHAEYSMTELLSQAYSKGNGFYNCPIWMSISLRDLYDPLSAGNLNKQTGGINIIDLANVYSCPFIATQDIGRLSKNGFEVLGRFDNSDIRGCNLLVQ